MNKQIWILIFLAVIIVILAGVLLWPKPKSTGPLIEVPGIMVLTPRPNSEVSSPIKITGYVNGKGWVGFEGQVGNVSLIYQNPTVEQSETEINLGTVSLTATEDWMQTKVNFEAAINFNTSYSGPATLIFHNENPSGDPIRDKTFILPINIIGFKGETATVKLYFMKASDSNADCKPSSFTERVIPKTQAIARAALEELLKGPTEAEKLQGYSTIINFGVKVQSLNIDNNGEAKADFSQELESTGGSCRVTAIRAEINQTLKQFPTIKSVIISINGRTEDILQP